jgi:chemotaxis methyl-accepting protein methylase
MMDEEEALELLKERIHRERGFNSRWYKEKCLVRRIAVRMRARGEESIAAYVRLLEQDPAEYDRLVDALTINVTKFFRNAEVWGAIGEEVVPWLLEPGGGERRIWSAGCASGEEPYSFSILLRDAARRAGREADVRRFRILATDIDRASLEAARGGEYLEASLSETPPEIAARWFSPGPRFRLADAAREGVEFARRDLISEPAPPDRHVILCRTVIIYFDREIQEELFLRFHESLVPGGFLVLGKVETLLGRARGLFQPVRSRERIFRKPA